MSPILVRPVREQFEHERGIRVLQARYKKKYEVAINPGAEQNASVGVGGLAMYPDLVLFSQERSRKLQATIEVETTESVNTLEAMAEWGPFSRLRAQFFLYVPPNAIDTVRRLCVEHRVEPAEIWTYHTAIDQVRFTMVHRAPEATHGKGRRADRTEKPAPYDPHATVETEKPKPKPEPKATVPANLTTKAAAKPAAKTGAPMKKTASAASKKSKNAAAKKSSNDRAKKIAKRTGSNPPTRSKPARAAKSAKPTRKAAAKKPSKAKRR